jgi:hypothetical protein
MTDDKKSLAADSRIVGFRVGPSEAGRWLIEAKDGKNKLAHGEFEKMVQDDDLRSPRAAQMLMAIARHPLISNAEHVRHLPPAPETLYELTKVEPKTLEAAIKDGRVNPKTERKEVVALLPAKKNVAAKKETRSAPKRHYKEAEVVALADKGLTVAEIAAETDLGKRAARHFVEREQVRREAVEEAEPEIDARTLSLSAQKDGRVNTLDEVDVNALIDCADQALRERSVH